jgi:hypothetical protein
MKWFNRLIRFLSNDYGDDIGRGKTNVSKHRHKHKLRVRLRRLLKKQINEDFLNGQ